LLVLQRGMMQAADALTANLSCDKPSARNTAAVAILDRGLQAVELSEVLERLTALEELVARSQKRGGR
jgi:hypothetical protein